VNLNRLRTRAFPPEPKSLLKNDRKPNTKIPGPRAVVAVATARALRLQSRVYMYVNILFYRRLLLLHYYKMLAASHQIFDGRKNYSLIRVIKY